MTSSFFLLWVWTSYSYYVNIIIIIIAEVMEKVKVKVWEKTLTLTEAICCRQKFTTHVPVNRLATFTTRYGRAVVL